MVAVRDERRRTDPPSGRNQQPGPEPVHDRGGGVDPQANGRRPHFRRREDRVRGLVKYQQRSNDDQHALEDGREVLRLVMAERMVVVGRLVAEADGPPRRECRDHVDDRFQRVRIERDGPRQPPGGKFQPHHRERDDDRQASKKTDARSGCCGFGGGAQGLMRAVCRECGSAHAQPHGRRRVNCRKAPAGTEAAKMAGSVKCVRVGFLRGSSDLRSCRSRLCVVCAGQRFNGNVRAAQSRSFPAR